ERIEAHANALRYRWVRLRLRGKGSDGRFHSRRNRLKGGGRPKAGHSRGLSASGGLNEEPSAQFGGGDDSRRSDRNGTRGGRESGGRQAACEDILGHVLGLSQGSPGLVEDRAGKLAARIP